ncbi:MAG TPA: type II CAAX endopeptidase family protein [Chloroflexota bacterium]|nr:type II CAAX endopeptidase family protein [Chloroflexota bacterium]
MINWRVASVPALKINPMAALRGVQWSWPRAQALPRVQAARRDTVPWTWVDLGRIALFTAVIAVSGALALVLVRLGLSIGFAVLEGMGMVRSGTFDHLSAVYGPYSAAGTMLLGGGIVYGGLFYAIHRYGLARHGAAWGTLGFHRLPWARAGRIAALFIPITLGGVVIMHLEAAILGPLTASPGPTLLTRGMPALPGNFVMLFLLLVVITPIAEETFFRGFLYKLLRNRLPTWAAASLSAGAFAAIHGAPTLFPWLFYMGIVYALLAERTGSLWSSILIHALANGLVTFTLVVVLSGW